MSFRALIAHFFQYWIIFFCLNAPQFIYLFTYWRDLGGFYILEIELAVNLFAGFCLDTCFNSFGWLPKSVIAWSYRKSMFTFVRNFKSVFQSGHTVCIRTSSKWEPLLLCILTGIWGSQCSWVWPHSSVGSGISALFEFVFSWWHILCAYLLSMYLLWWGACSYQLHIFKSGCLFSFCEFFFITV